MSVYQQQEVTRRDTMTTHASPAGATAKATATATPFDKYSGRGLTGLCNLGNTCFANACIQCLSHTYELNDFLSANGGAFRQRVNKKLDSVLLIEWDKLRQMMWSENCTISPGGFINSMQTVAKAKGRDSFTSWNQNDLPEFLMFMIDTFHNALSREVVMQVSGNAQNDTDQLALRCLGMMKQMYANDYSEMLNLFYGIQMSIIASSASAAGTSAPVIHSLKPEPFFIINVPIPAAAAAAADKKKAITLLDCFREHCKPECMEGDDAWHNESTGKKENVTKKIGYWSLPNVMVIDIKRFVYTAAGHLHKNQTPVDIPLYNVDFSEFVQGYNRGDYVYDLYAICNHHGNVHGGHYTATVKNANGKWYNFNDTTVKEIPFADNSVNSSLPYCLFYRKVKVTS